MSIKIEGGEGAAENIIKAGTSNQLLYNDKEVVLKENFLNLVYPVGSIYWSSNNTNPGTLFGGTWTQIKDRFILAAGDSYSNGATGGAATVTLTVSNMPSHSHFFVPSGTVGSHSHFFVPSGTVGSHSHFFVPSGTVDSHSHTISSSSSSIGVSDVSSAGDIFRDDGDCGAYSAVGHRRFRKYVFTGASTGSTAPSFTGTAGHTEGTAPSFTGTAGYTEGNGSGTSFSIMPPYIVKYCWERTA